MKKGIESLILDSLIEVIGLNCINESNVEPKSKLIYPITRNGVRRVSEQESRFIFIKNIELNSDFLYSIEAPTLHKYFFTGKEENKRSGNFDVCLYDENKKRKHLIEFKALNPKDASYEKDFEKLINDEDGLTNYFIQIIISSNDRTLPSIEKKYDKGIQHALKKNKDNKNNSKLVIFLCEIGLKKRVLKYEILNSTLNSSVELFNTDEIDKLLLV